MGLFDTLKNKYDEHIQARNEACNALVAEVENILLRRHSFFENNDLFIDLELAKIWFLNAGALQSRLQNIKRYKKAENYNKLEEIIREFIAGYETFKNDIVSHNNTVAKDRVTKARELIGTVEGRELDFQQMMCIVKENHNHLVIAGAGTGKTTTIVGKIKYMLKSGKCKPNDILVLSFTNASAAEMKDRIEKETGEKIMASTFHKLGLSILARCDGVMPKITTINMRKFIGEQLQINMKSRAYLKMLMDYVEFGRIVMKSEFDFEDPKEYEEHLRLNPPITLNKETVKSYGEMNIANFLKRNGVKYEYEREYEVDTRTEEYTQYIPDFYLPDYNIYIEYFGINRNGHVPSYFTSNHGKSASEEYNDSIVWKRNIHKENNTVMIECYSYENMEGILLDNLEKRLKDNNVELNPVPIEELWKQLVQEEGNILDGVIDLFETVISLIKSNNYTIEDVRAKNASVTKDKSINNFISLVEPIFVAYESYLLDKNEIDFNDMINKAAQYIRDGKIQSPYKYVIVDEYQDMAKARYNLLKAMRDSTDYELFCVGDDWQSIYRFAGSDIGLTLNFEDYWGATERSKIETTYRFNDSLIEISGNFVMQNPQQLKKKIKGRIGDNRFALGEISGYKEEYAIDFMVDRLNDLPKNSSVFFIGRYTFDSKLLDKCTALKCKYDNASGRVDVFYSARPDLKMEFISAHKSKGLQADYAFILNNKDAKLGFPSKIQDASILGLLLDNCDQFPYAEERRLFYVALTRAKVKSFIITVEGKESEFAIELKERYDKELKAERFTCPECGGRLIKHSGKYGDFYGCSNYKINGCKYKKQIIRKS